METYLGSFTFYSLKLVILYIKKIIYTRWIKKGKLLEDKFRQPKQTDVFR